MLHPQGQLLYLARIAPKYNDRKELLPKPAHYLRSLPHEKSHNVLLTHARSKSYLQRLVLLPEPVEIFSLVLDPSQYKYGIHPVWLHRCSEVLLWQALALTYYLHPWPRLFYLLQQWYEAHR